MTPSRLLASAIEPALSELSSLGIKPTDEARTLLLAIALQETNLQHRRQVASGGEEIGPAMSFWQFERAGGCRGVLKHRMTAPHMRYICAAYDVPADEQALWEAIRYQDLVAAAAARLLIFTLPGQLPRNAAEGWEQYLNAWRPGKPHPETWPKHWATAESTVRGAQ